MIGDIGEYFQPVKKSGYIKDKKYLNKFNIFHIIEYGKYFNTTLGIIK